MDVTLYGKSGLTLEPRSSSSRLLLTDHTPIQSPRTTHEHGIGCARARYSGYWFCAAIASSAWLMEIGGGLLVWSIDELILIESDGIIPVRWSVEDHGAILNIHVVLLLSAVLRKSSAKHTADHLGIMWIEVSGSEYSPLAILVSLVSTEFD